MIVPDLPWDTRELSVENNSAATDWIQARGKEEMRTNENIVPCVIFVFNRPDKLEQVLSALKTQDIDRLIVFVDGPRDHADVQLVERCMTIATNVGWVDKELHFEEQNRGLPGLSKNIGAILNTYRSAVFLEDDCLPMPGFYSFMRQALFHYQAEKKVFSIGGYQPLGQKHFRNYPYSLISVWRFTCWGWATWRDRWKSVSPYLSKYSKLFDGLKNVPDVAGDDLAVMVKACAEGKVETWDAQVAVSTLWLKKVHLLSTRGLIRNIGLESGVHGGGNSSHVHNVNLYNEDLSESIVWLNEVEPGSYYNKKMEQFVNRPNRPPSYCVIFRKLVRFCRPILRN